MCVPKVLHERPSLRETMGKGDHTMHIKHFIYVGRERPTRTKWTRTDAFLKQLWILAAWLMDWFCSSRDTHCKMWRIRGVCGRGPFGRRVKRGGRSICGSRCLWPVRFRTIPNIKYPSLSLHWTFRFSDAWALPVITSPASRFARTETIRSIFINNSSPWNIQTNNLFVQMRSTSKVFWSYFRPQSGWNFNNREVLNFQHGWGILFYKFEKF